MKWRSALKWSILLIRALSRTVGRQNALNKRNAISFWLWKSLAIKLAGLESFHFLVEFRECIALVVATRFGSFDKLFNSSNKKGFAKYMLFSVSLKGIFFNNFKLCFGVSDVCSMAQNTNTPLWSAFTTKSRSKIFTFGLHN